jgi:metallophosphoesterase (TIGR03767 family)
VRELVAGQAQAGREGRRSSLTYFTQLSDFQLADEESPARVEFSDNLLEATSSAWRPMEAFGPHTVDAAIRQVNRFAAASPVAQAGGTRASMDFALTTGDNADNQQYNETLWVRQLLEGGSITPNSGIKSNYNECSVISDAALTLRDWFGERNEPIYTGVQDFNDQSADTRTFYDPNQPQGQYADWPRWTGLMDRAQQTFTAAGLRRGGGLLPSYVANGNHDGLVQGNQASIGLIEGIATGCFKPLVPSFDFEGIIGSATGAFVRPDNAGRRHLDKAQLKAVYAGGSQADGHGFGLVSAAENTASRGAASYYAWDPKPGVRFIALDTISEGGLIAVSADGNIDDPQFTWLTNEITAAAAARKLVVVYAHHPIRSLTANITDELAPSCSSNDSHGHDADPGCDRDPRSSSPIRLGADLQRLFNANPHVVAYVTGHTHENRVMACGSATGCPAGGNWWEINTASEIDWPQQSRLVEIMDNRDGSLSIFGTLLDHAAAYEVPRAGSAGAFTVDQMAAISRTLSYNDPQATHGATGTSLDQNVELLVRDPR